MKNLKFLSVLLFMLTMSVSFTACSDDDDNGSGGSDGAPYCGVWRCKSMKVVEDGESYSGNFASNQIIKLTLNEDHTFEYYVNLPAEDGEPAEVYTDRGTWTYDGEEKELYLKTDYSYAAITVKKWTASKLVTYQEEFDEDLGYDNFYSEERTWELE